MEKRRFTTTFTEEELKDIRVLAAILGVANNTAIMIAVSEKLKELVFNK